MKTIQTYMVISKRLCAPFLRLKLANETEIRTNKNKKQRKMIQ